MVAGAATAFVVIVDVVIVSVDNEHSRTVCAGFRGCRRPRATVSSETVRSSSNEDRRGTVRHCPRIRVKVRSCYPTGAGPSLPRTSSNVWQSLRQRSCAHGVACCRRGSTRFLSHGTAVLDEARGEFGGRFGGCGYVDQRAVRVGQ